MYFVVCAAIVLAGLVLVTPSGARTLASWQSSDSRGLLKQEDGRSAARVRQIRMAGAGMIVGPVVIAILYLTRAPT